MKKAVILFNLGGPDKLENVKPFLFNLFNDRAILNLPSVLRYPLAKLISNRRAPIAKKIYQEIGGSSPILKLTEEQSKALELKLNNDDQTSEYKCFIVMRCWHPRASETVKNVKHYNRGVDITKTKQSISDVRCYNCHHTFKSIPFYLPIDYCSKLQRYKLFGNFCSPNCVKSYCISNKTFENKSYLVGQFYRALFGQDFRIKCAPSIFSLKEYGGDKSIEEFRKSSYANSRYTMNNINTKIINI